MAERQVQGNSVIEVTIGGHTYPVKHYASCRVCTSPYRLDIERALIGGLSYKNVISGVVEGRDHDGEPPATEDLAKHVRDQHLPVHEAQKRALIERRADQLGKSIEEGQDNLLDYVGVNEAIIERGFERIVNKEINPDVTDLINALKLQHSIEAQQEGSVSDEVWMEAMTEHLTIVQEILPRELWEEYGKRLEESAVLQAVAAKMRRQQIESN